MITAGAAFIVGSFLMAFAQDLPMLVVGRAFLGWGVGFANQSAPLYLSEMAPAQLRGALNIGFQMATTLGILVAGLINYGMPVTPFPCKGHCCLSFFCRLRDCFAAGYEM